MAKIKARAKLIDNVQSVADNSRKHSIVLDLETTKGGDDTGPTALEVALMALADCAVTICASVAKNSNITLTKVEAYAEAEKGPDSPKLTDVTLKVHVAGKGRKELLETLWKRTEANCPVLDIFKDPMPLKVELETTSE